MKINGKVRTII